MGYTKSKISDNTSYDSLRAALKNGNIAGCYVFHGRERYLLWTAIQNLRKLLCPDGLDSFNYKRFDGKQLEIDKLEEAVETFPAFGEKTLIEVHDYDIFSGGDTARLCKILEDIPSYACVAFIYDTIEYKTDNRLKTTREILKNVDVVEFNIQDEKKVTHWIIRHFRDAEKHISPDDAQYLAMITDGLLTTLHGEIKKISAYSQNAVISKSDIDAVVIPALDAVAYMLTDAVIKKSKRLALQNLDKLLQMREAPHKLLYSISARFRQLLAARVFIDNNIGKAEFMKVCSISHNIQADKLFDTARKTSLSYCKRAVTMCSLAAKELNSTANNEARITELVVMLTL
ncbi:MAG: DNA polymerase III subunit delta [Oscillospiraceae bacterium]|nr:DNA polymerase III subunit delta [Oscillospiraceae bacterium]